MKSKRRHLKDALFIVLLMFFNVVAEAQQRAQVQGTVMSSEGTLLEAVTVTAKDSTQVTVASTITATDGKFKLNGLKPDHRYNLHFSLLGYDSQSRNNFLVRSGENNSLFIRLDSATTSLDEVVIVGYGTQRKVNLTGSVAVVSGKELQGRSITNSSQALQGVPGLYVNQAGGQPGADAATIRVRGMGTIGGGSKLNPLVLVDGVEYSLSDVNPNDIESISVLKDAASSSIYGSRAANGVILVTTKLGKSGRTSIDYSNYFGTQEATYLPDPVSSSVDFMTAYNQAMVNQGSVPYYSADLIEQFRVNPTSQRYPNTNWMDVMFGSAPIQEHNLRLASGNNNTRYNLSVGYLNQDGVLKGMTGAERFSFNFRLNTNLSERLSLEGGVIGNRWNVDNPSQGMSTVMNRLMRMVPIQPVGRLENGNWPDSWVLTPGQNSFENPLIFAEEGYQQERRDRLLVNLALDYKLAKGLNYQIRGSVNQYYFDRANWRPEIALYSTTTGLKTRDWASVSIKSELDERNVRLNATHTLNYEKTLGEDHRFQGLLGSSIEKFSGEWDEGSIRGFPTMDLTEINVGTHTPTFSGTSYEDALVSYFGRVQYAYKDRYLAEFNSRYDGSSRFAKNNRWGFFPSVSLGWRISQESFLIGKDWINEIKLRGSWGQIGNQEIGRFQYVNAVALGYGYPFGGTYQGGTAITQNMDDKISWETTTMRNLGLDWSIFGGKLSGEVDVFHKRTDNILRTVTLPAQVGSLNGPIRNLAVVDNKGFELGLNHSGNISPDLSYTISGSITRIKNEVVDLNGETIIGSGRITRVGEAIDSWYVYKTDGLFQTQAEVDNYPTLSSRVGPGDVKYVDLNEDGKIDGDDRYIAGNTFPTYTFGFNAGFKYKGLSLQTVWQGVSNIDVYLDGNLAMPFNNGAGLTKNWLTDSWTPENTDASLPRITTKHQYAENFSMSDFWLRDASYLRLKNIQVAYDFKGNVFSNLGINNLRIFANAQNLFTISDLKLFDPEKNISQNHIGEYPSVKTVSVGLNVNF